MAKFEFYQEKQVKTWIRDYFTIEAETLEDAIAFIKEQNMSFDDLENEHGDVAEFSERDLGYTLEHLANGGADDWECYSIFSVDLENRAAADTEVLYNAMP